MRQILQLIGLSFIFLSCMKEIDIEYPEDQEVLVLNALLDEADTSTAAVSITLPYEQLEASPYFKDADLYLFENDQQVEKLNICSAYRTAGGDSVWRYCSFYNYKPGAYYTVKAHKAGYPVLSGTTRFPSEVAITSISEHPDEEYGLPVEVSLQDPAAEDNYYILEFIDKTFPRSPENEIVLRSSDPDVELYAYYGLISVPLDDKQGYLAFFTDQHFNGKKKTVKLRLEVDDSPSANPYTFARLHSVSRHYYEYTKSININRAVGENPFSEPIRVISNIENGVGVVGARQTFEWKR